jgi:hypothetical protein
LDPIIERFNGIRWKYAVQDKEALAELEQRLEQAARKRSLITYSDLVRGITFNLPSLRQPIRAIDVSDWQDLDRAIVGDFLGYRSMRSYEQGGFFVSALVVSKLDGSPSEGFYALMKELGLVASSKTDQAMYLFAEHVAKAHTWYERHRDS